MKKGIIIRSVVIILCLTVAAFLIVISNKNIEKERNLFYAVSIDNGDMYFGHYYNDTVHNAWIIRKNDQGGLSTNSIRDLVWKPAGDVKINSEKVVVVTQLADDSPVVKAIREAK